MSTSAVTPAESAPAPETEVSVQERLNGATSKELDTWRKTGDIPAVKVAEPKPAAPAPAEEKTSEAKSGESPAPKSEPAAASPAAPQQKQESRSERRFREITRENRELRERLERLEAAKPSQPAAALSEKPGPQPEAAKSEPEKRAKPKLEDNDPKTGKPFTSIQAWSDAVDEWKDEQWEAKLADRLSKAEQTRTQAEQSRSYSQTIFEKLKPAAAKYADFEKVALSGNLPIPIGSPANLFIDESENPGEILYYLGQHPEVLAEFYGCTYDPESKTFTSYGDFDQKTGKFTNHVSPVAQVKRLTAIEKELTAPKKTEKAEPAPAPVPPPKLPPPPSELSGRRAAPIDDAEAALARGDTAAYMRAMNARDLKASRR